MSDIMLIIVSILATWRLTYMLQEEDGPWAVFARLQAWMANKERDSKPGSIYQGFFCFYCLSMWVAAIFTAIVCEVQGSYAVAAIYWFGLSAGAVLVNLLHKKLEQ